MGGFRAAKVTVTALYLATWRTYGMFTPALRRKIRTLCHEVRRAQPTPTRPGPAPQAPRRSARGSAARAACTPYRVTTRTKPRSRDAAGVRCGARLCCKAWSGAVLFATLRGRWVGLWQRGSVVDGKRLLAVDRLEDVLGGTGTRAHVRAHARTITHTHAHRRTRARTRWQECTKAHEHAHTPRTHTHTHAQGTPIGEEAGARKCTRSDRSRDVLQCTRPRCSSADSRSCRQRSSRPSSPQVEGPPVAPLRGVRLVGAQCTVPAARCAANFVAPIAPLVCRRCCLVRRSRGAACARDSARERSARDDVGGDRDEQCERAGAPRRAPAAQPAPSSVGPMRLPHSPLFGLAALQREGGLGVCLSGVWRPICFLFEGWAATFAEAGHGS